MSGLLQRLAARATGNAWALQSDARLPFAAMPGMPETQDAKPLASPSSQGTPKTREGAGDMVQPVLPWRAPQPARTQQTAAGVSPATASNAQSIPAALPSLHDHRPEPPQLHDQMRYESPTIAHATVPRQASLVTTVEAGASYGDPPPLLPPRQMHSAAAAHQRQVSPGAPHAAHAFMPSRQAAPAPAEPAEVHVHIGRIEVTAITQPQTPRRAAREAPEPLSLDAYLARRKEPS